MGGTKGLGYQGQKVSRGVTSLEGCGQRTPANRAGLSQTAQCHMPDPEGVRADY